MDAVLLPYQQRWIADPAAVRIWEKSRRIGASWCAACEAALLAAKTDGSDCWYIGYSKDMAVEFIRDVAFWAQLYGAAAADFEELVLEDERKDILAYRIKFASGKRVTALSSRPTNLRSKQGFVILDEAAFHDDLTELIKAALALWIWGDRIVILSSHNGADNPFAELIEDVRAGKRPFSLHRTTIDDALADGLYKQICLKIRKTWSPEAETAWRAELFSIYGDGADEELLCIPKSSSGAYLTRNLIEACMSKDIPVLRWTPPAADFVDWPEDRRMRDARDWCMAELAAILDRLPRKMRNYLGEDFGRSGDLTVLWPLVQEDSLRLITPCVVELRNCPFRQQEQILFFILDRLPRFSGAALDARGNGQYLAEVARQRYGQDLVAEVMLSEGWYRENMPKLKAALEDKDVVLPKDAAILDDLRAFKVVKGVAKIPDKRTADEAGQRHGDAGVAVALAVYAAKTMEAGAPFAAVTAGPYETTTMLAGY